MKKDNLPKGVYKIVRSNRVLYCAGWYENGEQKTKSFNANEYGDELAYKLACDFRKEKEKELNIVATTNEFIDKDSYYVLKIISKNYKKEILFDKSDFNIISKYTWYVHANSDNVEGFNNGERLSIIQLLFGTKLAKYVIHKNKNRLDNRRENFIILKHDNAATTNLKNMKVNNTSGKTGVYITYFNNNPNIPYWAAYVTVKGKQYKKAFSTKKYGETEAYRLACEARNMLAEKYENYNA